MNFDLNGKAVKNIRLPTVTYDGRGIKIVPAQEGDTNSRYFSITMFDDRGDLSLDNYYRVILNTTLPDGSEQTIDGEINKSENLVVCKLSSSMISQIGKVSCDITLLGKDSNGEDICLTSQTFYVLVSKSKYPSDDAVEGDDNYPVLVELINEVSEMKDRIFEEGFESGAAIVAIQPDWNERDDTKLGFIKNKPEHGNIVSAKISEGRLILTQDPGLIAKGDKGDAGAIKFIPLDKLPDENIEDGAVYLIPSDNPEDVNAFNEYIYVNDCWELIGIMSAEINLDEYLKKDDSTSNSAPLVYTNDEARKHYLGSADKTYLPYNIPMIYGNVAGKNAPGTGYLLTNTPINPYHCANKAYVDTAIQDILNEEVGNIENALDRIIEIQNDLLNEITDVSEVAL